MINEKDYENRVYGCYLGKCIGGNIGAPYEGMKQRMHLKYTPAFMQNMLPNDDLDLQVLWLDLLEEKGNGATVADYADAFNERCGYAPGEYAFFKKNYRKGIMPPLSGTFNNEYFNEGMGAPIRSELWACLYPCDSDTAAFHASLDASVDHREGGESANGEMFLAALESLCFGGGDVAAHIKEACGKLPKASKLRRAILDVAEWCARYRDIDKVLDNIIRDYGHSESAMVHQNISIIVAALLLNPHSFTDAVMAAVNCGFDTDCTGATVGSVMGILAGGEEVTRLCGIGDATYKLGVKSHRTDLRVSALSQSVCELRQKLLGDKTRAFVTVTQLSSPAIGFGEECELELKLHCDGHIKNAAVSLELSPPLVADDTEFTLDLCPDATLRTRVRVPKSEKLLPEAMPCRVIINGSRVGRFGMSGKRRWRVYGPYWKNNVLVPPLEAGESYWKYIPGEGDAFMDALRFFHISGLPDSPADMGALVSGKATDGAVTVDTAEDIVRLGDCTGFRGNSTYVFTTEFFSDGEMTAGLQIGRNTPVRVWLNGELLAERDGNEMFYHETIHKLSVKLNDGVNRLAVMIIKNNEDTRFSYEFLSDGVCSDHIMFSTVNTEL